jgi:hypothetical protein
MLNWDAPLSQQHDVVREAARQVDATLPPETLGKDIYQRLAEGGRAQATASESLRALGVPGVRYLDGGSRTAGQGTSNFVVFPGEESLLSIIERNGKPLR